MRDRYTLMAEAERTARAARAARRAVLAEADKIARVIVDWMTGEVTVIRHGSNVVPFPERKDRP
jgi:hypothetical protein